MKHMTTDSYPWKSNGYWDRQARFFDARLESAKNRLKWAIDHHRPFSDIEGRGESVEYFTWARNMAADFATYGNWKPDSENWK